MKRVWGIEGNGGALRRSAATLRHGFTLIEILTVIVIIAILAALLFPAIKSAIIKAETARARTMVQQSGAAFRAYFTEFSMWPTPTNASPSTVPFDLTTNLFANSAKITFLDVPSKDIGATNSTYSGAILDPWQKPYRCLVDANYSGSLPNPFGGGAITNGYLIWSEGPDGMVNAGGQDVGVNKDNIRSW